MLQIMRAGGGNTIAPNASWSRPLTPCVSENTGRLYHLRNGPSEGDQPGDLAWATMLAVINEPIGGEGKTSVSRLWSSDEQKK